LSPSKPRRSPQLIHIIFALSPSLFLLHPPAGAPSLYSLPRPADTVDMDSKPEKVMLDYKPDKATTPTCDDDLEHAVYTRPVSEESTEDAVFGALDSQGPNYRAVSTSATSRQFQR
jgi:hypothetical protein